MGFHAIDRHTRVARKDAALNGSTVGHSLIWIYSFVGLLTIEKFFDKFLNLGNTRRTADQDNLVDFVDLNLCIFHYPLDWLERLAEQVGVKLLELGSSKSLTEVVSWDQIFNIQAC